MFSGRSQQRGGYGGRGFRGGRFGRNNMNNNNNNNRGNRSMGGSFNGGAGNGIPDGLKDLLQRYLPNLPMDALFELQAQQSQQNNNNSDGASGHVDWTFPIGPEVDYDVVQVRVFVLPSSTFCVTIVQTFCVKNPAYHFWFSTLNLFFHFFPRLDWLLLPYNR